MKTMLFALLVITASVMASSGQRPYQHPEGTIAHQAAQNYTNEVYRLHNQWQAMKISKQQFIKFRQDAWEQYLAIAFPPQEKIETERKAIPFEIQQLQLQLQQLEPPKGSLKPGEVWRY